MRLFSSREGPATSAPAAEAAPPVAAEAAAPAAAEPEPAVPEGFKILREGKAKILQKGNDVFYNEAQVRGQGQRDAGRGRGRQSALWGSKGGASGARRRARGMSLSSMHSSL